MREREREREREIEIVSVIPISYRGAVKSTCKMLMELGIGSRDVYEDDFERPLLEESREFYRVNLPVLDAFDMLDGDREPAYRRNLKYMCV